MLVKWWEPGITVRALHPSSDPIMRGLPSILYRWGSGWLQSSFKIANLFYKMDGAQSRMPEILCSHDAPWEWLGSEWKLRSCCSISLLSLGCGDLLGADAWSVWMCLFHGWCESYHMRDMGTVETNPQGKEGIGSPCYIYICLGLLSSDLTIQLTLGSNELCILFTKFIFPKVNLVWLNWSLWGVVEY